MKKRILFLLFLFPMLAYCQYYVGRYTAYNTFEFNYYNSNFSGAINADGSVYMYDKPANLRKITIDGTPYPGFGNNGLITNVLSMSKEMSVNDQNIFLSSISNIAKYDLNGNPDLSFGINGIVTIPNGIKEMFANPDSSLFYTSDGKIRKLLSNGQIDNSFGINVHNLSPMNAEFFVIGNNIYVYDSDANSTPYKRFLKKYDLYGAQDMTYGNNGSLEVGRFPIFNKTTGEFYNFESGVKIIRYTSTGVLDITFGVGGIVTLDHYFGGFAHAVSDSNNNILFFGGAAHLQGNESRIYKLKQNGEVDNTFNNGSYKYTGTDGAITQVRLVDDNTYVTLDLKSLYGLPISNVYYYRNSKYVRTLNLPDITLNVKDTTKKTEYLKIYPNPATDFVIIDMSNAEKISKVNIFAMTGELVISGNETKIDIRNLPAGNYILEAKSEKNKYITKFIKK